MALLEAKLFCVVVADESIMITFSTITPPIISITLALPLYETYILLYNAYTKLVCGLSSKTYA